MHSYKCFVVQLLGWLRVYILPLIIEEQVWKSPHPLRSAGFIRKHSTVWLGSSDWLWVLNISLFREGVMAEMWAVGRDDASQLGKRSTGIHLPLLLAASLRIGESGCSGPFVCCVGSLRHSSVLSC